MNPPKLHAMRASLWQSFFIVKQSGRHGIYSSDKTQDGKKVTPAISGAVQVMIAKGHAAMSLGAGLSEWRAARSRESGEICGVAVSGAGAGRSSDGA